MLHIRVFSQVFVLGAALFLGGCFVTATNMPAGKGPVDDPALVGNWRGLDSESGKETDVFIHIQRPEEGKPLRLVYVEGKNFVIYEMSTTRVGNRSVFYATVLEPEEAVSEAKGGSYLGFYEIRGMNATFYLLDAEKVSEHIRQGKVRGTPGPAKYDIAKLTGSPAELATFLASADGWASRMEDPARLRRIVTPE
jgi:hypothetical protein